jgi:hypothetical protein
VITLKSALVTGALAAVMASTAVVSTASADVACNRAGECWHVRDHLNYPGGVGITFHADNWANAHHRYYHWRQDRFDRGYYRNGVWVTF